MYSELTICRQTNRWDQLRNHRQETVHSAPTPKINSVKTKRGRREGEGKKNVTTICDKRHDNSLRAQRLKNFKIALPDWKFQARLKISISTPSKPYFFCGEFWRSGLKISIEIENFKRDWNFQSRLIFFNLWALRVYDMSRQFATFYDNFRLFVPLT